MTFSARALTIFKRK